jgi:tetratricopeptide (TPR) repeat protein
LPLQIRVGLNSGEVVVRSIRSDLRMDYSAVGQTTHVAARMEQMALPGSILLSAPTLALAEGHVEVKPLGPLPVRGLQAPLPVYELVRAATIRSRFQAAAARGLTRFVGRDSELEQLGQALERARAGHGQVVAVVGEPGVGKSRLYWEFTRSHRARDWLVLESASVSYGKASTYLPVSQARDRVQESEQVVERFAASGHAGYAPWGYHAMGRACFLLGRLDEARGWGERAVEAEPAHPGFGAHAEHLLGEIASHPDRFDPERSEAHYRRALALAEPRGMRPLVAHCHLGPGRLARQTGARERAAEHLTTAAAMYREMDMRLWLPQAEGALREALPGARP